jgi:hypothetical protein
MVQDPGSSVIDVTKEAPSASNAFGYPPYVPHSGKPGCVRSQEYLEVLTFALALSFRPFSRSGERADEIIIIPWIKRAPQFNYPSYWCEALGESLLSTSSRRIRIKAFWCSRNYWYRNDSRRVQTYFCVRPVRSRLEGFHTLQDHFLW